MIFREYWKVAFLQQKGVAHTLDNALPALPLAIIWSLLISLVILQFSEDTILFDELLSPKPAELVDLIPLSLDISWNEAFLIPVECPHQLRVKPNFICKGKNENDEKKNHCSIDVSFFLGYWCCSKKKVLFVYLIIVWINMA